MKRVLLLTACALAACGGPTISASPVASPATNPTPIVDSQAGEQRCLNTMPTPISSTSAASNTIYLEAAFDSTSGTVAAWRKQQLPGETAELWDKYGLTLVVTVCYLHGDFGASFTGVPYDRGVVVVGANGVVDGRGPVGSSNPSVKGYVPLARP